MQPQSNESTSLLVDIVVHSETPLPVAAEPSSVDFPVAWQNLVRRAVQLTAAYGSFRAGTIDVAIVDDAQIKEVNVRHLQHDWETDVISFPYQADQGVLEGELVISWETALRESRSQRWPAITELILYAIHGTLHLTGMDDATPPLRAAMRSAETKLLAAIQPPGWQFYQVDEPEESA